MFASRNMRLISIILLTTVQTLLAGKLFSLEEAKKNGMWETLQNYIRHNSVIADICVYEQEWLPPSEKFPKGQLIQRAVVTHIHRGSWKIGQRIEYTHFIEDAPRYFGRFVSTVPGKLRTFFYQPDGSETSKDGMIVISGDGHWGFGRVDDVFAKLFALELKSNAKLKPESEQGVAPQSATRSESKSEGSDKPQLESKERSR